MIFDNIKDVDDDIRKRIEQYLKNNTYDNDVHHIISLISSYLTEIKILKEIDSWSASGSNDKIIIRITKNDEDQHIIIDLDIEIRKLKISKIKSSRNSDQSFLEIFY